MDYFDRFKKSKKTAKENKKKKTSDAFKKKIKKASSAFLTGYSTSSFKKTAIKTKEEGSKISNDFRFKY